MQTAILRFTLLFHLLASLLFLSACEPASQLKRPDNGFPNRPTGSVLFYNDTDITDVQLVATQVIKRASRLTQTEYAMALLTTLPKGYTIETYSAELFDYWRVGEDHNEQGVLFVLVQDNGQMKIEVSYELEDTFPDAFCKSYQDTIKMYFASKHFGDVISHSINNMARHYAGQDVVNTFTPNASRDTSLFTESYLSGGAGITESDYFANKEESLKQLLSLDQEIADQYQASTSIHESLRTLIRSMRDGINYPYLDVLTQGTRYERLEYPDSANFLIKRAGEYLKAMPYRVIQQGDLAAIRFHNNAAGHMLFVRGTDGKWRYDLTKSWASGQVSFDFSTFHVNEFIGTHPWQFAFPDQEERQLRVHFPAPLPSDLDLMHYMDQLKAKIHASPEEIQNYTDLANLLFWELYWIQASVEVAEAGLRQDPNNQALRWLAIFARYRAPLYDGIEPHYIELTLQTNGSEDVLSSYKHFIKSTESAPEQYKRIAKKYNYE